MKSRMSNRCEVCGLEFASGASLTSHMLSHQDGPHESLPEMNDSDTFAVRCLLALSYGISFSGKRGREESPAVSESAFPVDKMSLGDSEKQDFDEAGYKLNGNAEGRRLAIGSKHKPKRPRMVNDQESVSSLEYPQKSAEVKTAQKFINQHASSCKARDGASTSQVLVTETKCGASSSGAAGDESNKSCRNGLDVDLNEMLPSLPAEGKISEPCMRGSNVPLNEAVPDQAEEATRCPLLHIDLNNAVPEVAGEAAPSPLLGIDLNGAIPEVAHQLLLDFDLNKAGDEAAGEPHQRLLDFNLNEPGDEAGGAGHQPLLEIDLNQAVPEVGGEEARHPLMDIDLNEAVPEVGGEEARRQPIFDINLNAVPNADPEVARQPALDIDLNVQAVSAEGLGEARQPALMDIDLNVQAVSAEGLGEAHQPALMDIDLNVQPVPAEGLGEARQPALHINLNDPVDDEGGEGTNQPSERRVYIDLVSDEDEEEASHTRAVSGERGEASQPQRRPDIDLNV